MGAPVLVENFSLNTSGSTQTFSLSGETRTPDACLLHACGATTNATFANGNSQSWGAVDGTNEWCGAIYCEDAQAVTDTYERHHTDACIVLLDGTGAVIAQLSFNSFGSGSLTLDIDTTPSSAFALDIVFFFDSSAEVGTHETSSVIDTQTSQTGMGFDPSSLLIFEFGAQAFSTTVNAQAHASIGFVADNAASGTLQGGTIWYDRDARGTSDVHCYTSTSRASGWITSVGSGTSLVEFGFTSDGFTSTVRTKAQMHRICYVALDITDVDQWAGVVTAPTATGDFDFSDPDSESVSGLIALNGIRTATLDTWRNAGECNPIGLFKFDSMTELSMAGLSENGQGTSDTACIFDNTTLIKYGFVSGTVTHDATFSQSLSAGGFRVNSTTANSLPREWPIIVWSPKDDRESVDEVLNITEEAVSFGEVWEAVDEALNITEEAVEFFDLLFESVDETLQLLEDPVSFGEVWEAVNETLNLLEEVEDLLAVVPAPSSQRGVGAFARVEAGQGAYPYTRGSGLP